MHQIRPEYYALPGLPRPLQQALAGFARLPGRPRQVEPPPRRAEPLAAVAPASAP